MSEKTDDKRGRIEWSEFEAYTTVLREPSRPPSQGGNTSALHSHRIVVDGRGYTFLARGSRKWAHKGDQVRFSYVVRDGRYRNILTDSFETVDKAGRLSEAIAAASPPCGPRRHGPQGRDEIDAIERENLGHRGIDPGVSGARRS